MLSKPEAFFSHVREHLASGSLGQEQVDGFNAIRDAWDDHGDEDPRKLAYLLATAWHETGRFKHVREIWGPTAAQKRYEGRADLGNNQPGDGKKFMGRGFVQLTGRRNYADWSKRLGMDLLKEPTLVEAPDVASRILVQGSMLGTFTGKKLGDFINASKTDYINARRVINGTDKAQLIAGYADQFEQALSAGGYMNVPVSRPLGEPFPGPATPPDAPIIVDTLPPHKPEPPWLWPLATLAILGLVAAAAWAITNIRF